MEVLRDQLPTLVGELDRRFASVLVGPRQVGKTYLLRMIEREARRLGKRTRFFDLENPEDLPLFNREDREIMSFLRAAGDVVFLDEFHYLQDAGRLIKALHDSGRSPKVYASGSSSPAIHAHLRESLAGRYRLTRIAPLAFLAELSRIPGYTYKEYLIWGGMPGLTSEALPAGRMALLRDIVAAYLLKDVKALVREENIRAFNTLLVLIAQAQGSVVPVAGLARDVRLSEPTVARYLDILEATYVIHPIPSYSGNLANELRKSRKYFLFDLGIRNMLLKDFSPMKQRRDRGAVLESFVTLALLRKLPPNAELRFWRTRAGDEVDIVLVKDRVPYPIEVKATWEGPHPPDGLRKFLRAYPEAPSAIIYTEGAGTSMETDGRQIHVLDVADAERCPYLD
jgi:uncharacterized protein